MPGIANIFTGVSPIDLQIHHSVIFEKETIHSVGPNYYQQDNSWAYTPPTQGRRQWVCLGATKCLAEHAEHAEHCSSPQKCQSAGGRGGGGGFPT